jgi:hypothetical protein
MEKSEFGPRIYHQADKVPSGGESEDWFQRDLLLSKDREYGYADRSFVSLVKDLGKLDKAEDVKKPEIRERLKNHWENLMMSQLTEIENVLDYNLLRLKSPYPYDSRNGEFWFEGLRKAIGKARQEEWGKNQEAKNWLNQVELDSTWGESNFRMLEGVGTILPKFFNWLYILNWVREGMRTDPIGTFYEQTFSKETYGLKASPIEVRSSSGQKEEVGLREKAIKYQDDCAWWRMAVAATGQAEYKKRKPTETFMNLHPEQVEFINKLFGEYRKGTEEVEFVQYKGHEVPKGILNWYSMSHKIKNKRRYIATMEALLTTGAKDRLDNLIQSGDGIDALVEHIEDLVLGEKNDKGERKGGYIREWFSPDRPLKDRLAGVVVKSGIVFDWGHMTSGRLGWVWQYDENGKRKVDSGGTTAATDVFAPFYWRYQEAGNQTKDYASGMLPPMSKSYREILTQNPPGWRTEKWDINDILGKDEKLKFAWDSLWEGDWDEDVVEKLKEMVWFWETPINVEGKPLIIPVFFPPEVASLNFWDTISFEGSVGKGDPSVWEQLISGEKKMSELEWQEMGDQALYRWMITIGQTVRFLTVMLEPENTSTEGQFKDFFENTAKAEELLKRCNLGTRDERVNLAILTISLAPMLVVLKAVDKHGIFGEAGEDKERRTLWAKDIAKWMAKFSSIVEEREGIKGYNTGLTNMAEFYTLVLGRLGTFIGEKDKRGAQNIYNTRLQPNLGEMGVVVDGNEVISTEPPTRSVLE